MMASRSLQASFIGAGVLHLMFGTVSGQQSFNWKEVESVIAFGDSYTFVRGTNGWPGYSFLGSYLPEDFAYTPQELLESQIIANFSGTSAGGPNWVEYLTGCGLDGGLVRPVECKVQLWDFAFAGSNTAEWLLPPHRAETTPLVNQTQQYLAYGDPVLTRKTCLKREKSLVAIWIGINDINDAIKLNIPPKLSYAENIQAMIDHSVTQLYERGYRNFLFVGLPPLHRTPSNQKKQLDFDKGKGEGPKPNATMIGWWYNEFNTRIDAFADSHEDAKMITIDAFNFLNGVLDHPKDYGISNTTDTCAGRPPAVIENHEQFGCPVPLAEYFWFDAGHIGTLAHKALTTHIEKVLLEESQK